MKNTHIQNLNHVVPADIRLQTYKDALEYFEQRRWNVEDEAEGHYGEGLCLVLPCIMWGLYNYMDSFAPDGYWWSYMDTIKAFPELGKGLDIILSWSNRERKIKVRMELLRKWIKELSDEC